MRLRMDQAGRALPGSYLIQQVIELPLNDSN